MVAPVGLPAGLLKVVTSPCSIGSLPVTKTIGMVLVAAFAGSPVGVPVATMTAEEWATAAERYEVATQDKPAAASEQRKAGS